MQGKITIFDLNDLLSNPEKLQAMRDQFMRDSGLGGSAEKQTTDDVVDQADEKVQDPAGESDYQPAHTGMNAQQAIMFVTQAEVESLESRINELDAALTYALMRWMETSPELENNLTFDFMACLTILTASGVNPKTTEAADFLDEEIDKNRETVFARNFID